MPRRRRIYKTELNNIRFKLYKANQLLDFIEAIMDFRHKPSYWNMRKLITRMKKIQR